MHRMKCPDTPLDTMAWFSLSSLACAFAAAAECEPLLRRVPHARVRGVSGAGGQLAGTFSCQTHPLPPPLQPPHHPHDPASLPGRHIWDRASQ